MTTNYDAFIMNFLARQAGLCCRNMGKKEASLRHALDTRKFSMDQVTAILSLAKSISI